MKINALALSLILTIPSAMATTATPSSVGSEWYYTLGGEDTVSPPPSYLTNTVVLGGSADWGLGFNCSAFNPTMGVANTLNRVKAGLDSIQNQLVNAATGAIASLPLLLLQRANPGLYDMLMSSTAKAEERVRIATKSCETAMREIGEGKNPYRDWVILSRDESWRRQMGNGSTNSASKDVIEAKKTVDKENGDKGFTWIGGEKAGGIGHPPARIPTDIAVAGYNLSLNRAPNSTAPANTKSRVTDLWGTPLVLKDWSRNVLGEERIRTYNNHPTQSIPGKGLAFQISKEAKKIEPVMDKLVSGELPTTKENLEKVSAPSVVVTRGVIQSLQKINPTDSKILKHRLVQDVATAREVEKALMLRRLVTTGLQEPNIAASGVAEKASRKYINQIDTAINDVLFEQEVRHKLASSTSKIILGMGKHLSKAGNRTPITRSKDNRVPEDGGFISNSSGE